MNTQTTITADHPEVIETLVDLWAKVGIRAMALPKIGRAGTVLADKTAALEDQLRAAEERAAVAERVAEIARANPERVEVPVIPEIVMHTLSEVVSRAEQLADRIETP